jgi:hypothetical protein
MLPRHGDKLDPTAPEQHTGPTALALGAAPGQMAIGLKPAQAG